MILLNMFFALLAVKWLIESEKYSIGWYVSGICFVLNTLAVLQHLDQIF